MKKIFNILALSALTLFATSCEDWLDMPSESKADTSSIFQTLGRAEMTVVGAYTYLHTQELGYQLLMGTDESVSAESNSKYNVSNFDYTNLSGMLSKTYITMYKAIDFANICIKNLPQVPVASEADQKKLNGLLGEALAIRAYAYWNIVRFYGDVPYSDIPTLDKTEFASSRVSRDLIYDNCVKDLQRAVELLPWQSEGYVSTPERFTKNSAYGVLARVALYAAGYSLRWDLNQVPYDASTVRIAQRDDKEHIQELYQIAANACKEVITKGENGLLDNYDRIFRDLGNHEYNKETMLEYGMYSTNAQDVRTGYTNGIPTSGTDNNGLGKGGSQMIAFPTFFFEFDENDQRRDVSICNYGLRLSNSNNAYQMNAYIGMGVGKYRINWKKERGSSDSKRDINWPMLRYSDVLLMYAEALNELNNGANAEAVDAVKTVRKRAFRNDESKIGTIPTGYQEFKDYLIKERKLELSNEGLRKSDLARWGILVDHLTAEKEKLVRLAKREGEFADIAIYRAYKLISKPGFEDSTIALSYIPFKEVDLAQLNLSDDELNTLHVLNAGAKGAVKKNFYEYQGQVYYNRADVPADANLAKVEEVEYTVLNMFSINTIKNKGNLCVEDVEGFSSNNPWITGTSGVFYGMKKNMVEILPFNTTNILDVNPGLAGQQHPCY